ncbi:NUDIX hydrolase [Propionibacteriaceae bacterium Y1923]
MSTFTGLVENLDGLGGPTPVVDPTNLPFPPPARSSAILALLSRGGATGQPDLLFTERAHDLRSHPGQVSFPGGRIDPGDPTPEDAAVREAAEEVGLEPEAVELLGRLPSSPLVASFNATVVVGAWDGDHALVPEPGEVAQILRYPVDLLASPDIRRSAKLPNGRSGPAFVVDDIVIWGFTAHLVDRLLALGGWAGDWDTDALIDVPERFWRGRRIR